MRQVCHRLLGAREEAAKVQLDRLREHMRARGVPVEDGELSAAGAAYFCEERSRYVISTTLISTVVNMYVVRNV